MGKISTNLAKFFRFIKIYGLKRTVAKVTGRLRPNFKLWLLYKFPAYNFGGKKVAIIGCGHHAFSSIAYYLTSFSSAKILFVHDINFKAANSLAKAYNSYSLDVDKEIEPAITHKPSIVYIASNHATHSEYAIKYLQDGCDVFIEKPIAMNLQQLEDLSKAESTSKGSIYSGYNRPNSKSIELLKRGFKNGTPFTLNSFVTGHFLDSDHWYRKETEGTRIVSNLSHWIDLGLHILYFDKSNLESLNISIMYSDINLPSENISISMASNKNDLLSIIFSCRSEPFEGVNETINFQQGDNIIKIDDFRRTYIWQGEKYRKYSHWPKNNGHKKTILSPINNDKNRDWSELKESTKLMLHIEDMLKNKKTNSNYSFSK